MKNIISFFFLLLLIGGCYTMNNTSDLTKYPSREVFEYPLEATIDSSLICNWFLGGTYCIYTLNFDANGTLSIGTHFDETTEFAYGEFRTFRDTLYVKFENSNSLNLYYYKIQEGKLIMSDKSQNYSNYNSILEKIWFYIPERI